MYLAVMGAALGYSVGFIVGRSWALRVLPAVVAVAIAFPNLMQLLSVLPYLVACCTVAYFGTRLGIAVRKLAERPVSY